MPITASETTKTLNIGGSVDVDGDVMIRGRLFAENTQVADRECARPTKAPREHSATLPRAIGVPSVAGVLSRAICHVSRAHLVTCR